MKRLVLTLLVFVFLLSIPANAVPVTEVLTDFEEGNSSLDWWTTFAHSYSAPEISLSTHAHSGSYCMKITNTSWYTDAELDVYTTSLVDLDDWDLYDNVTFWYRFDDFTPHGDSDIHGYFPGEMPDSNRYPVLANNTYHPTAWTKATVELYEGVNDGRHVYFWIEDVANFTLYIDDFSLNNATYSSLSPDPVIEALDNPLIIGDIFFVNYLTNTPAYAYLYYTEDNSTELVHTWAGLVADGTTYDLVIVDTDGFLPGTYLLELYDYANEVTLASDEFEMVEYTGDYLDCSPEYAEPGDTVTLNYSTTSGDIIQIWNYDTNEKVAEYNIAPSNKDGSIHKFEFYVGSSIDYGWYGAVLRDNDAAGDDVLTYDDFYVISGDDYALAIADDKGTVGEAFEIWYKATSDAVLKIYNGDDDLVVSSMVNTGSDMDPYYYVPTTTGNFTIMLDTDSTDLYDYIMIYSAASGDDDDNPLTDTEVEAHEYTDDEMVSGLRQLVWPLFLLVGLMLVFEVLK